MHFSTQTLKIWLRACYNDHCTT